VSKIKYTIGCDPGDTGAIALLEDDKIIDVWDMPLVPKLSGKGQETSPQLLCDTVHEIYKIAVAQWADGETDVRVVIERVHAMPKQGVASVFTFGKAFGLLIGVMASQGWPITFVTPQKWKKQHGLIGKPKDASRGLVLNMFPDKSELFKRKKDHGRADAVLIGMSGAK